MASIASLASVIRTSVGVFGQRATGDCFFRNVGQVWFGLIPQRGIHLAKSSYKVTIVTSDGRKEFECPDNVCIHSQAEKHRIDLPFECMEGNCYSCAGHVLDHRQVHQPGAIKLNDKQVKEGWVLTCVAYPRSDVVIDITKKLPA